MNDEDIPTASRHRLPVYDRLAAGYDRVIGPLERFGLAALRAATLRELPPGSSILEVGAGTGANFPFYAAQARGVASELSRAMLDVARAKKRPAGLSLMQASVERLPFADDSFDAAFATLVLCSVSSPAVACAELRRVVRRGGTVALLEHVRPEGLLGYVFDAFNKLTVALIDDHVNRRTADEAARAGLRLVRVENHLCGIIQIIVCRIEK